VFINDITEYYQIYPKNDKVLHMSDSNLDEVQGVGVTEEINEIITRSISEIYPSKEEFKKVLNSGKKLRVYIGADATGSSLHLGHSTNFLLLEKFRKLGHEVIVLFGDFTARIGDPTDKDAARVKLSKKEVEEHIKSWKKQISKVVYFSGKNKSLIKKNSKWLSKINFEHLIELSSFFTVQQMMERDMFNKRLKENKPIYLHEFLYPLMQGYDSVAMDVDVEIGGTDQTFNMLAGRTLQKKINNKEKFVITTTLLENPLTGKKLMSKSEGSFIGLDDTPTAMFGKVMALPDEIIIQMFVDTTLVSSKEINEIKKALQKGDNPKDSKIKLAYEIVKIYHGEKKANQAKKDFISVFSGGAIPKDVPTYKRNEGESIIESLFNAGVESKTELKRLIQAGSIKNLDRDEIIKDWNAPTKEGTYKIGKHRFLKIT